MLRKIFVLIGIVWVYQRIKAMRRGPSDDDVS